MSSGDFAKTYLQLNDAEKAVSDIERLLDGLDGKMDAILAEAEAEAGAGGSASGARLDEVPDRSKEISDLVKLSNEIKARMDVEGVKLDELSGQVGGLEKQEQQQEQKK